MLAATARHGAQHGMQQRAPAREGLGLFALASPALLLVGLMLIVPLCWLLLLSFTGDKGGFTLGNYAMMFQDKSYASSLWLTVWMSALVTGMCIVCGYALAYGITLMPGWLAAISLMLVALPFWTSVLVRTYAWMVLLQSRGVVNTSLIKLGIISEPIYMSQNRIGAVIGMLHIMLPFMVFPLYAALKRVDMQQVKAASSLGASAWYGFRRVYFPQTVPGLVAGCVLVFVTSLGFYITPALLGGGNAVVLAMVIERDVNFNQTWGPASAVAMLFIAVSLAMFFMLSRHMSLQSAFGKD